MASLVKMGYGMRMWSVPEGYVYHGELNGKTAEFLVPYNQHFLGNFPKLEELFPFLVCEDIWDGVEQTEDPNLKKNMIENDKQLEVTIKALNTFKERQGTFGNDALGKIMKEATQSTIDELEEEIRVYCESKNYKDTYKLVMTDITSIDVGLENLPPQKQFKDDNKPV